MHVRAAVAALVLAFGASGPARAGDWSKPTFSLGGDVGGTGRYLDNVTLRDPDAFGLRVGLHTELHVLARFQLDATYVDGRIFDADEDRFVDLTFTARTPRLLFVALDVHELYWRASTRAGDPLLYVLPGVAFLGDLVGTLKFTAGYAFLRAGDTDLVPQIAQGGFGGLEYVLRSRWVDLTLRGAFVVAWHDRDPHGGLLTDGALLIKIPAGPVGLGPRLDVTYRHLGLFPADDDLFGQRQELTASLGFAVTWGTGTAKAEKGPGKRR